MKNNECDTYLWPSTTVLACASNNRFQRLSSFSGTDMALLTVLMADAARDVGDESASQCTVGNKREGDIGNISCAVTFLVQEQN